MKKEQSNRRRVRAAACCALAASSLSLSGCGTLKEMFGSWSFGSDKEKEAFEPAATLIAKGMNEYNVGNYADALKSFQEVIDRYPFSPQGLLAELKAADCQYYSGKYEDAKSLYKIFEEQHPTNEAIPYAMFQIGMCDFSRADRIDRDPGGAEDALKSFNRLLRAYPESPYTSEAKARINAAREFLVNHEYFVAVFYVRTQKYDQAKHRLKFLIATYPQAEIIPKAKELLSLLEAGNPPRWGLNRWLPDLKMPSWMSGGETDTSKQAEENQKQQ